MITLCVTSAIVLTIYLLIYLGSFTHTIRMTCSGGTGNGLAGTITGTGGAEANISETVPIGTDTLIAYTLDVSQAKSVFILCDVNATLETNSSSAPARTLTLIGGEPIAWCSTYDSDVPNPFGSTDITALYLTNAAEAQLEIRVTLDPVV